MSGGVDSTVAAALLIDEGYEVFGVNFLLYDGADSVNDAKIAANQLKIPLFVLDLRENFKRSVIDYFAEEYRCGRTPNPCVMCNKKIKFGSFLSFAEENGADFIATGHYAKIIEDENGFKVKKADNSAKDQSYVLYNLNQAVLSKTLFPISGFSKDEIRKIAREKNISAAEKPDSQDICFIPNGDYVSFLQNKCGFSDKEGAFLDDDGNKIGTHKGAYRFTVGQRKGLGMTFGKPMFVSEICAEKNTVTLSEAGGEFFESLTFGDYNFISGFPPEASVELTCKTRYSAKPCRCFLKILDDKTAQLDFNEPVRAVTCGQSVVLYEGDNLLGGGVIVSAKRVKKNEN